MDDERSAALPDARPRAGHAFTPPDDALDRLTRLAAALLDAPAALVVLLHDGAPVIAGRSPRREAAGDDAMARVALALGRHVAASREPLLVDDARSHPPAGTDGATDAPRVASCAAVPLRAGTDEVAGVLCVLDVRTRAWTAPEAARLADLGALAAGELERRRAEAALSAETERHHAFFDQSPQPMWVYDRATLRIVEVNDAAVARYGWPREEFVGMSLGALRPEEDVARFLDIVRGIGPGDRSRVAVRHRTKDGAILDVEVDSRQIQLDGRACRLVVLHDVTERRRAEAAREASEAQFRAMFDGAGVGIALVGPDGRIVRSNPALQHMLGYTGAELRGMPVGELRHPEDRHSDRPQFEELLAGRRTQYEVTKRYLRKDGSILWARLSIALVRDAGGGMRFAVGMIQDVTDVHRADEARRESEERYRQLVEGSPDGIVLHHEGRITFANAAAARIVGASSPNALIGRAILDHVHPENRAAARARIAEVIAGRTVPPMEQRWLHVDGSTCDVEVVSMPFTFHGLPGIQTVFRDVTERRQLEEQLRQSQKLEAVGKLAGGVAHDFNNLLTVIRTSTEFLLEDLAADDARRADAEQIRDATERATGLTRQLLAFSRKQILTPSALDLNAVVRSVESMLARLIGEDVVIETRLGAVVGSVMADARQLELALMNLVVNARDAMPEGGRIVIETADVELDGRGTAGQVAPGDQGAIPAGAYVMLAVSDTGTGMPPEIRARIFEPFFTTKEAGKGTGLGLPTVYGIVRQSGGHIWAQSEPGEGSTFRILLPRRAVGEAATAAPGTSAPGARGSETILLVEDEDAVRTLARRILGRQGYAVLEARNGREALGLATRHEGDIHLVLTDAVMPEMGGRALVEALRGVRPATTILYMSGYTDDDIVRRGILASDTAFVHKPFTAAGLLAAVRDALDRGRAAPRPRAPAPA